MSTWIIYHPITNEQLNIDGKDVCRNCEGCNGCEEYCEELTQEVFQEYFEEEGCPNPQKQCIDCEYIGKCYAMEQKLFAPKPPELTFTSKGRPIW